MEYICDDCNNIMNIKLDPETKELHLDCHICCHKKKWSGSTCIYKTDYDIDLSKIINTNPNITKDNTLPSIKNNKNINCINEACESHSLKTSNIKFIKYNKDKMNYMYICNHCGQTWKNVSDS